MKIRDALYTYPGSSGAAVAHLRVYSHAGRHVAIVGQLSDSTELSITNAAEVIFDQLAAEYGEDVTVVEYYPIDKWGEHTAEFDHVTVSGRRVRLLRRWYGIGRPRADRSMGQPAWHAIDRASLSKLTGTPIQVWPASAYTSGQLLASGTSPVDEQRQTGTKPPGRAR